MIWTVYCGYLYFQLYSHAALYSDDNTIQSTKYVKKTKEERDAVETFVAKTKATATGFFNEKRKTGITFSGCPSTSLRPIDRTLTFSDIDEAQGINLEETPVEEEEEAEPQMTAWMTILLLAVVIVVCFADSSRLRWHSCHLQLVIVTADWLVDSISGLTETHGISKEFVAVILLPIVGNAAGNYTIYHFYLTSLSIGPQSI